MTHQQLKEKIKAAVIFAEEKTRRLNNYIKLPFNAMTAGKRALYVAIHVMIM